MRTAEEYAQEHIPGSILVPLSDIEAGFGIKQIEAIAKQNLQSNHTQPKIVLYCTSGMRSIKAYKLLQKTRLNTVVLAGGINAWRAVYPTTENKN